LLKKELDESSSLAQTMPKSELKRAPKGLLKVAELVWFLFQSCRQKKKKGKIRRKREKKKSIVVTLCEVLASA
jgi:hypothetical protein